MTIAVPTQLQLLLSRWGEALGTPSFKARQVTLDHLAQALVPARERSFQRLLQALFREGLLDASRCAYDEQQHCWLSLNESGALLRFEHLLAGGMHSWQLRGSVSLYRANRAPYELQYPSELLQLLRDQLAPSPVAEAFTRLAAELDDSFANDTLCLAYHHCWNQQLLQQTARQPRHNLLAWLQAGFVQGNPSVWLEQWGTLGHPWHPNYKTKLGLSTAQVVSLSPEFEARVAIRLCALHRGCGHVETLAGEDYWPWWQGHFPLAAEQLRAELTQRGLLAQDYLPLPVHPWQISEALPRLFAAEIAEQRLLLTDIVVCQGHPSMSFRTVLPDGSLVAPMVKLPVALRLTSVQRTVSPRSARMGPRVSRLLLGILAQEPELAQILSVLPERVGLHFSPQPVDDERSRHLAVLYRDNPQSLLQPGELAVPVGSLFAHDGLGQPLLRHWVALAQQGDDAQALLGFFADYAAIAVPGLLGMYLLYGVAFEAHQQNSFMVMDAKGQPSRLLLRDFGDIRIHRQTLQAHGLNLELHDPLMTLLDDAEAVRDKLLHTSFMCHLGELVLLCARHWRVSEQPLWAVLARQVSDCFEALRGRVAADRWQAERCALLEHDWPAKAFIRMRLADSHVDIVGRLSNPLRHATHGG